MNIFLSVASYLNAGNNVANILSVSELDSMILDIKVGGGETIVSYR